jgi:replicative DNA helicase
MPIVLAEVAKNRTGATGKSRFAFFKSTSTFKEITE